MTRCGGDLVRQIHVTSNSSNCPTASLDLNGMGLLAVVGLHDKIRLGHCCYYYNYYCIHRVRRRVLRLLVRSLGHFLHVLRHRFRVLVLGYGIHCCDTALGKAAVVVVVVETFVGVGDMLRGVLVAFVAAVGMVALGVEVLYSLPWQLGRGC